MSSKDEVNLEMAVARNEDIIFSDMGEDTVMMSIDRGEYYGLNPVGRRIWELLEEPMSVQDLRDRLCAHYDVTADQCGEELKVFLERLLEKDIIRVAST